MVKHQCPLLLLFMAFPDPQTRQMTTLEGRQGITQTDKVMTSHCSLWGRVTTLTGFAILIVTLQTEESSWAVHCFGKEDTSVAHSAKSGGCDREKERHEGGHRACYNHSLLQGTPETAKMTPTAVTATQPGPEITSSRWTYFINLFHFPWKLPSGLTGHICTQGLSALLLVCAMRQKHFTHEQGS